MRPALVLRRLGVLSACLTLLLVGDASAATTEIGRAQGQTLLLCQTGTTAVQVTTGSGTPSYSIPAGGGLLTSWSTSAAPDQGSAQIVQLLVWRADPSDPRRFTLVAASPEMTLTPGILNTFGLTPALPVQAGDLLGLRVVSGPASCFQGTGDGADFFHGTVLSSSVPVGSRVSFGGFHFAVSLNVAATVVPPQPTSVQDCGDGGWQQLTDDEGRPFRNMGECVRFVASRGQAGRN